MPQTSLAEYVKQLDQAGLLTRYKDEKRVDELPTGLRHEPQIVKTAPCKDVIVKGNDVDLTIFPLFHHHPGDGHAYLNDTKVVSRDPDTGLSDQGIYRFMYRSKNETNIDIWKLHTKYQPWMKMRRTKAKLY